MTIDYSVIIPAYNEAALLPGTLTALKAAMAAVEMPGEVIVVDNHSTDATAQIAESFDARVVDESVRQISRVRNTGAAAAQGRFLVFLDADTILSGELLRCALGHLAGEECCGGGAMVACDSRLPALGRAFVRLWNWCSLRLGLAAGCFIYCLRSGFDAVGGFSEKVYASEEIWFSRGLRAWGKDRGLKFKVILDPPVLTSARKIEWHSPLRLLLWTLLLVLFPFGVRFRRLCDYWYSRPEES